MCKLIFKITQFLYLICQVGVEEGKDLRLSVMHTATESCLFFSDHILCWPISPQPALFVLVLKVIGVAFSGKRAR